jgi:hypothetical protein
VFLVALAGISLLGVANSCADVLVTNGAICHCREPTVSRILGYNWWPMVPGYFTPTVAPVPSVAWVAVAGHSTVDKICTHMVL